MDPDKVVDAPCRVVNRVYYDLIRHLLRNVQTADDAQPRNACHSDWDTTYGVEVVGKRDLETKTGQGRSGKEAGRLLRYRCGAVTWEGGLAGRITWGAVVLLSGPVRI